MAHSSGRMHSDRAVLTGDACLFAAAVTCLVLGGALAPLLGLAAAWVAHRRPIDRPALLSAIIGLVAGGVVVAAVFFGVVLVSETVGPIGGLEFVVPVVIAALFAAAFLGVAAALTVSAIQDLSPDRRTNVRLDVLRLVCAGVVVLATLVIVVVQLVVPGTEFFELGIFALLAGLGGAVTAYVADLMYARIGPQVPAAGNPAAPGDSEGA